MCRLRLEPYLKKSHGCGYFFQARFNFHVTNGEQHRNQNMVRKRINEAELDGFAWQICKNRKSYTAKILLGLS
jgi:hypothetical protein